ncbi:MAG: lipoate--protein ligase family protein [Candidatus Anammoxibacter sp.]
MKFRFIDTGINNGVKNMALDEAVMSFVRTGKVLPTIRLYQWRPSCLSLGHFQILSDINMAKCKEQGVDIVRRLTGGKAVLHNDELTYSFIAPRTFLSRSIKKSYKTIADPILNTLKQLGLNASLNNEKTNKVSSPICFYDSSCYEINVNNKKIVGSAQTRIKDVFLQHGSILLDFDPDVLCFLFDTKDDNVNNSVDNRDIGKRVTSIKQETNKSIELPALKSLLIENFEKSLNIEITTEEITDEELLLAKELEDNYEHV